MFSRVSRVSRISKIDGGLDVAFRASAGSMSFASMHHRDIDVVRVRVFYMVSWCYVVLSGFSPVCSSHS
jgi:hypothetical protein